MSCKNHNLEGYVFADKFRFNKCYLYCTDYYSENFREGRFGLWQGISPPPYESIFHTIKVERDGKVRLDINSSSLLFLAFHFLYFSCFSVTFFS